MVPNIKQKRNAKKGKIPLAYLRVSSCTVWRTPTKLIRIWHNYKLHHFSNLVHDLFTLEYLKLLQCPLLLYFYKIPLGGMGATKSLWTNNLILKYLTNLHLQTGPLEHKEFSGNSRNRSHIWKVSYSRLYNSWGGTLEKSISCFCSDKTAAVSQY